MLIKNYQHLHIKNNDINPYSSNIDAINNNINNININDYNDSTVVIIDENSYINFSKMDILKFTNNLMLKKNNPLYNNNKNLNNLNDNIPITLLNKAFNPNTNNNISFIKKNEIIDLNFITSRYTLYNQLYNNKNIIKQEYKTNYITTIILNNTKSTFISLLKNMSKDIQFDIQFKNNKTIQNNYLLDNIKIISDSTIYLNQHIDMDDLNLNKINISIINAQDQYVAYNIKQVLTPFELNFIKYKCKLHYKFINKYAFNDYVNIYKNLLIG